MSQKEDEEKMKSQFNVFKRGMIISLIGLSSIALAITDAVAESGQVTAKLSAFKVIKTPKGEEKLKPTQRVNPGDIVEYQVVYRNQGRDSAKQLLATLPVPKGMSYLPSDTYPAKPQASLDGKRYASMPLMHWVRLPDGSLVQREVPYSQYRSLQWNLGNLEVGSETTVRARVRVNR